VRDLHSRQGVMHLRVKGKRDKVRFVRLHVVTQRLIGEYLALAGYAADTSAPVFRPVTNNRTGKLDRPLDPDSVYHNIVRKYGREPGVSAEVNGLFVHSLRPRRPPKSSPMAPISPSSSSGSAMRMFRRRALRPTENAIGR
jgi:hypothetical protein